MEEIDSIIVRFSGDSGDGMQVVGNQFSLTAALMGNDISTFPDFPAEIRAPQGTIAGISGYQVHFGKVPLFTAGDSPDVLFAMNPAALMANLKFLPKGAPIIVNSDSFEERNFKKAGLDRNPLETDELDSFQVIKVPMTTLTLEVLKDSSLDNKEKGLCKNMFALGMSYFMFGRELETTISWLESKFSKRKEMLEANILALKAGFNYVENTETGLSIYKVPPAPIEPGIYRTINGNQGLVFGLILASNKSGLNLFYGSYPITPASDILHLLSSQKRFGVMTFQAEDEIAAVCSAVGASFGGALAVTASSGPGIVLKSEAIGLAVSLELPLVIINVQRGGPSTGLPTKTEQSDLNLVLNGRNGESPVIVLAASRPRDCFEMAFEAVKLTLEHMTPVFLLSDGSIANGSEPWKLPDLTKFPSIETKIVPKKKDKSEFFFPYKRNDDLVRSWAVPGLAGYEHRVGGLEKEVDTGNVSYNHTNHQEMSNLRQKKVDRVAKRIPNQEIVGEEKGELLVVSWGGTFGATYTAVSKLIEKGESVSLMHVKYLNPLPINVGELLKNYNKILVCELNNGQFKDYLNAKFNCGALGYNKLQGIPFLVSELIETISLYLQEDS